MLLAHRRYKTGMGFAVWRWTDVVLNGDLYLRRLHIIQVPKLGAIMLHWIKRPDPQPDLHDHPVTFLSIPLRGLYGELICRDGRYDSREIRWWNFVRAGDCHKIMYVSDNLLTLVFAAPKSREWGFHTAAGWVSWKDYKG